MDLPILLFRASFFFSFHFKLIVQSEVQKRRFLYVLHIWSVLYKNKSKMNGKQIIEESFKFVTENYILPSFSLCCVANFKRSICQVNDTITNHKNKECWKLTLFSAFYCTKIAILNRMRMICKIYFCYQMKCFSFFAACSFLCMIFKSLHNIRIFRQAKSQFVVLINKLGLILLLKTKSPCESVISSYSLFDTNIIHPLHYDNMTIAK